MVMDTAGLCDATAQASFNVEIEGPKLDIIQVSHEENIPNQLFIRWKYLENEDYDKPYYLNRDLARIDTLTRDQIIHQDTSVVSDKQSYQYHISTNEDCESNINSGIHRSIWLDLPVEMIKEQEVVLVWNEYEGWDQGVDKYEIWMEVDGGSFFLVSDNGNSGYKFTSRDLGFEHCFKIRADEFSGNGAYSWSNIACVTFIPELYPYNIITPNADGMNDVFIIENIEHYPNSVLSIFNRWGQLVYRTTGYRNNWGGRVNGKILLNSTYFYQLELNESRAGKKSINGMLTILR
jgi:gliding motility-associated-like protein